MFYCTFICLNLNVIGIERTLLHRRGPICMPLPQLFFCLVVVVILLFGHTTAFLQLLLQIERNHITPHALYALLKTWSLHHVPINSLAVEIVRWWGKSFSCCLWFHKIAVNRSSGTVLFWSIFCLTIVSFDSVTSLLLNACFQFHIANISPWQGKGTRLTGYFEVCKQQSLWTN